MKTLLSTLIILLFALPLFPAHSSQQGGVVSQADVDPEIVRRIYLGQSRALIAVNLPEEHPARQQFETHVLGRTSDQLRAHWSRLQFTGRATPLRDVPNDAAVLEFVRSSEHTIGYVSDISLIGDDLRVIIQF